MRESVDPRELQDFVDAALAFLERHARRRPPRARWGEGPDTIGVIEVHADREEEARSLAASRGWRARVFDAGFGWLGGPVEYGGAGRSPIFDEIYRDLEAGFDVPSQNVFTSATLLVAPAILAHGSDELQRRTLRAMFRGDVVCCQLLSEPNAGSDLASLRTRAVRDGDAWIVNGQKVWSSYAHFAEIGQLLARTDPDVPAHRGLTMFLVDMTSPGVEVRPLRQMTGEAHFNEIFLTDVRVPDENRVGPLGGGWQAMMTTFARERAAVGSGATFPANDPVGRVTDLARHLGRFEDPHVRQRLADVHIRAVVLRELSLRYEEERAAGKPPGPEGSITKLLLGAQGRRIADLAAELLGPAMTADTGEWGTFAWTKYLCGVPLLRIAGGTDEIQKNILAERLLGLPRDRR